ncbi:MAG TPA: carboxypeptidase regulatory-like domain-containing protein [Blastocatellia bacterium]|jgi:hypothetical protein|nr:carboxypeptidase regulatory-like domain-containing protein [Blastocatellia bacterium]
MFRGARFSIFIPIAFLGFFSIAGAQTPQADNRPRTASISGRVTISGKAAANAKITITEVKDGSAFANQDVPIALSGLKAGEDYVVLTDAEGRYRLTNLPEGRYQAQAMLKGWVREKRSRSDILVESFSLNEGESRENLDFTLVRGGVITGRVTDADGRPLIAKRVILQAADEQGRKQDAGGFRNMVDMLMNIDMFQTDDRGVYRIYGLRAGRYLVSSGGDSNGAITLSTAAAGEYPRTWHPDAADENQAKIIEVDAGGEVTGVDIKLGAAKRTYEAAGRVVDEETGNPIAGSTVVCLKIGGPADGAASNSAGFGGGFGGNAKTDEQGNFRLIGLGPGQYHLSLSSFESILTGGGGAHYSDGAKFEIQGADVAGVEIRAKRGATISGVAVVEDADPSAKAGLAQMMIMAQPLSVPNNGGDVNAFPLGAMAAGPIISRIGSDGGFILKGVRPGKVTLQVIGMAGGELKIARIERGGVEISDGIVVTDREEIAGVRVILGKGSGVIRGQIQVTGGAAPEGWSMNVMARREKSAGAALNFNDSSAMGRVDNKGRFVIEGLLPGEYELMVMFMPSPGLDMNSPNQFKPPTVTQKVAVAKGQESHVTMTLDLSKKDQKEE